ncbi:unnamed protein product [Polarella glacialis]|uniref:Uncharacterized protein n=1 Tax=Polarella glacialis TaxID=89957 RepID=A0A813FG78_POLGL|nr:unnamed protein product [Polarella glacialis]
MRCLTAEHAMSRYMRIPGVLRRTLLLCGCAALVAGDLGRSAATASAAAALFTAASGEEGEHRQENCDLRLLLFLNRLVEPAVSGIDKIHWDFTSGRHYEVIESISVFQLSRLSRSTLRFVESIRLTLAALVCPGRFPVASDPEVPAHELPEFLQSSKHVSQFFTDVRHLARSGGGSDKLSAEDIAQVNAQWEPAERELMGLADRLENWVKASRIQGGSRLTADGFAGFDPLIQRVMQMAQDFLRSLAEDMSGLFQAPNYVSREMTLAGAIDADIRAEVLPVTVDIFQNSSSGLAFVPEFMEMLRDMPAPLSQVPLHPAYKECASMSPVARVPLGGAMEFLDVSAEGPHRDIAGSHRRTLSTLQILHAVASRGTKLSNLFLSLQVSPYLLTPKPKCGSKLVLYDPSHCLLEQKWAGYFFEMNPLPPFNLSVVYQGKPLGPGSVLQPFDVHSIHVPTMETQWSSLVSIFKSMNHHSPDSLFVSPFVGNCQIIDRLLGTGTIKPKVIYLPFNPLVQPPEEVTPDFFKWWDSHGFTFVRQLMEGVSADADGEGEMPVTSSMWLAQCSLAASVRTMRRYDYELLHVEHMYAVYLSRPLIRKLRQEVGTSPAKPSQDTSGEVDMYQAWLAGWHCSPHSRFLFDLEAWAPTPPAVNPGSKEAERLRLRAYAWAGMKEAPGLRYLLERTDAHGLQRGRCADGICECLPPFRGPLCDLEDRPRVPQKLRGVIHYITAETEGDMLDIERSLKSVWENYNRRCDYPIVIFHEGLSEQARRRIVECSENRIWLALLPGFNQLPPEWAEAAGERASEFSVGYRAMTRWRSGPMFLEPALAGFDFAMTFDTDSYFPAALGSDPFEILQSEGLVALFPHLGRESASVVVNFMHHFLLYCRLRGMDPRRTSMLAALVEKNYKWYQQCLMLDMEVVRLDWFRGKEYQDFFRYMDSSGGFWLHRWGNNPVRTFGVGLLLEDKDVRSMELPYAHQDFCSCGPGGPKCEWDVTHSQFRCREDALGPVPRAKTEDLFEGLLDLQPWRGSDRQKERAAQKAMERFVQDEPRSTGAMPYATLDSQMHHGMSGTR